MIYTYAMALGISTAILTACLFLAKIIMVLLDLV